jgi:hypothetical protein
LLLPRESEDDVRPSFGGYRSLGGSSGISRSSLSLLDEGDIAVGPTLSESTVPVDLAARLDAEAGSRRPPRSRPATRRGSTRSSR